MHLSQAEQGAPTLWISLNRLSEEFFRVCEVSAQKHTFGVLDQNGFTALEEMKKLRVLLDNVLHELLELRRGVFVDHDEFDK